MTLSVLYKTLGLGRFLGCIIRHVREAHRSLIESKFDGDRCGKYSDDMIHVPACMAESIADAIEERRVLNKGYGTYDEAKEKEILERKYLLRCGAAGQIDRDKRNCRL